MVYHVHASDVSRFFAINFLGVMFTPSLIKSTPKGFKSPTDLQGKRPEGLKPISRLIPRANMKQATKSGTHERKMTSQPPTEASNPNPMKPSIISNMPITQTDPGWNHVLSKKKYKRVVGWCFHLLFRIFWEWLYRPNDEKNGKGWNHQLGDISSPKDCQKDTVPVCSLFTHFPALHRSGYLRT